MRKVIAVTVAGQFSAENSATSFSVTISHPYTRDENGDFCCSIVSEGSFDLASDIFGVTPHQAFQSAMQIVSLLVSHRFLGKITEEFVDTSSQP